MRGGKGEMGHHLQAMFFQEEEVLKTGLNVVPFTVQKHPLYVGTARILV